MQQNQIIPEATTWGGGDNTEVVANQVIQIANDALSLGKQDEALAKDDEIITNQDEQIAKQNEIIVNQTDLNDLVYALHELISRLAFLPLTKGVNGEIRVTPLSTPNMGTLSTLTTLTTLANQANIGGYPANQQIPSLVNMTAKSNIDNIVIS